MGRRQNRVSEKNVNIFCLHFLLILSSENSKIEPALLASVNKKDSTDDRTSPLPINNDLHVKFIFNITINNFYLF